MTIYYKLMKRIIERGGYDKADVQKKLEAFLDAAFLTEAEFAELKNLIRTPIVPADSELAQAIIEEQNHTK